MSNPFTTQTTEVGNKSVPIMLYTQNAMILGEVHVVSQIRVNTWLKTSSAPDIVRLYNAKIIYTTGAAPSRPLTFPELHLPAIEVLAMHLLPPTTESLDYDPSEQNRRMMPVTMLFNAFRADGTVWVSSRVDLAKFIELNRESFTSVYDVQITSPLFSSLPTIRVPMMICRQAKILFAGHESAIGDSA